MARVRKIYLGGARPGWSGNPNESDDESSLGRYVTALTPFEDSLESSQSSQPSVPASAKSSVRGDSWETSNPSSGTAASNAASGSAQQQQQQQKQQQSDYFKPRADPTRDIVLPEGSVRRPTVPQSAAERRQQQQQQDDEIAPAAPHVAALEKSQAQARAHFQQQQQQQQQQARGVTDGGFIPTNKVHVTSQKRATTDAEIRYARRKLTAQKYGVTLGLVGINAFFIFACWYWPRYYYAYLPFISFPLALNCIMIASLLLFKLRNTVSPERVIEPGHLEDLVMIMPCYNETLDECTRSLDSLVDQVGIEDHRRCIMVVCDGRVKGPGMEKTTAGYLMEDIFTHKARHERIRDAYRGWDGTSMHVEVARGLYKGVPYYCIVKEQNQGKRDSLIVVRSFLYKYNHRREYPDMIFSRSFFGSMSGWLEAEVAMDRVDHLVGMDADTVFDKGCIAELLKESKYADTVGVCGYVAVDFTSSRWNLWSLYQHAEYSIAQGLRRLHQSVVTKKVSCLPGCCQLLKICDYTCGDLVLGEMFGYHPAPTDGMLKQIRATASEDRNHVCLMLTTHPKAQTRQALWARAYTDVPHSWSVFLSQRRRWSLGATSNDLLLFTSWHCQWFERILAFCNVMVWTLSVFIVTAIGSMIVAFISQPWWIILAFASIMIIPLTYYIIMALWLPSNTRESFQYLAGLAIFTVCGPFLNLAVLVFSVHNMDSFGWGKTRVVITEDANDAGADADGEKTPNKTDATTTTGTGSGSGSVDEAAAVAGRNGGVLNGETTTGDSTAKKSGSVDSSDKTDANFDEEANIGLGRPQQSAPASNRL
ncbi:chitin synthase [Geosmithia morbida]|uniref:chitin synthase n=1 Tax=Geosmithia morbida TaxID=1094350 RepID=A0A9P4YNJ6_9HYPO|nr:chitin synthase [Geosmithia morbida]KAF4119727.1 chitin synthase [Geosmithia morbida]